MIEFDIYIAGSCRDNGKPTQIAGCGVVMVCNEEDRTRVREFGYGLGSSNSALSDVMAARLALASVKKGFRKETVRLHTTSRYVLSMLNKKGDGFKSKPSKNVEQVEEMRRWFSYYPNISLVMGDSKEERIVRAKELAKGALESQEHSDTGTMG